METFFTILLFIVIVFIILKIAKKVRPKTPKEFDPNSFSIPNSTKKSVDNRSVHEIEHEARLMLNEELNEPFDQADESSKPFFIFFDTETTGFIPEYELDVKEFKHFPFPVQLAWAVFDYEGNIIKERSFILLQPTEIPDDAAKIHKITTEKMKEFGVDPIPVYDEFVADIKSSNYLIAHNLEYDDKVIKAEFHRKGLKVSLLSKKRICTMKKFKNFCNIPFFYKPGNKYPKLSEFAVCAFNAKLPPDRYKIPSGHNAMIDVKVTAKCFFQMLHVWGEIEIEK